MYKVVEPVIRNRRVYVQKKAHTESTGVLVIQMLHILVTNAHHSNKTVEIMKKEKMEKTEEREKGINNALRKYFKYYYRILRNRTN